VCVCSVGKQVGLGYGGYRSWEQVVLVARCCCRCGGGGDTREENRKREDQMGRVDANDLLSSWIQRGINQALETGARPLCARRAHIKKCVLYSLSLYLFVNACADGKFLPRIGTNLPVFESEHKEECFLSCIFS